MESAQALGMGRLQMMTRIILPQVFRVILPPVTNEAITMVKNTSLLSTITVVELTLYSQTIIATTFRPFEFYIATAHHLSGDDHDHLAGGRAHGAPLRPLGLRGRRHERAAHRLAGNPALLRGADLHAPAAGDHA